MKRLLSSMARRLGWNLVKNREGAILRHHYAFQLNKLFALTAPTLILDVGGNRGQFHDFIRRFTDYRGPIVTFEPNPNLVEALAARAEGQDNWTIQPIALGAEEGEMRLNLMQSDDFSSFLAPAPTSGWIAEANRVTRTVTVPVKRLDQILEEVAPPGNHARIFLKLDTQGFDLQVFAGATGILPQIVSLQSEVAMQPIYEGMPDVTEALTTYRAAGFQVTAFSKVAEMNEAAVEFDCLMINTHRAAKQSSR